MASLKRYRQTTDSNAAARFRDLPPRFKRQKSIPSPESNTTNSYSNKQGQNLKPKKISHGGSSVSDESNINHCFSKTGESSKDKKVIKKSAGSRPHLIVDHSNVRRLTQPLVLSPMDSNLFNLNRSDGQDCSSMNTINPFSWHNDQQQLPWHQYNAYEQTSTSQADTVPFNNGIWNPSVSKISHNTEIPHNIQNHPASMLDINSYTGEPPKDYSETDRRIIEMFKELERVADQKEKEEDEKGTQGKSLVSHHLRMLMCAIDKYTEGIEDETDSDGRIDEAVTDERSSSPSSHEVIKTSGPSIHNMSGQLSPQFSGAHNLSTSDVQLVPSVLQEYQPAQHVTDTDSLYQEISLESLSKTKPPFSFASIDTQPWDLWSSPSFNVLDVYNNHSKCHNSSETADSTFALFDQLGMENDCMAEEFLTRTPLYRR